MMKRLPDTELVVMQAIWSCEPPVSRAEMQEILKQTHPMAQTTLLTLLTRLSEKGFIKIEKHGRISKYIPLISEREYLANQGKRFINQLCNGNISTFATALCDSGLTKEDLDELRKLLGKGEL